MYNINLKYAYEKWSQWNTLFMPHICENWRTIHAKFILKKEYDVTHNNLFFNIFIKKLSVETSAMWLEEEIVQRFSPTKISFELHDQVISCSDASSKKKKTYEVVLNFHKIWIIETEVYRIVVLLLASVEILWLSTEYKINGFKKTIWNTNLVLSDLLLIAEKKRDMLPASQK